MRKKSDFWKEIEYFKKKEFDCKCGCGLNNISHQLVERLNNARKLCQVPFIVNSAVRCSKHNLYVGGSISSSHLIGLAVDIKVFSSSERYKIVQSLIACGFFRIGIYKDFIHIDIDENKIQDVMWHK